MQRSASGRYLPSLFEDEVEPDPPLEDDDLQRRLVACYDGAVLVPGQLIRRVIRQHDRLSGLTLEIPHDRVFVIEFNELFKYVVRSEIGLDQVRGLPRWAALLARPSRETPQELGAQLVVYWRRLFHARVHIAMEEAPEMGLLKHDEVEDKIREIGDVQFAEACGVLRQEGYLREGVNESHQLAEFAAVFLELWHFAKTLLPWYFPMIKDLDRTRELLTRHKGRTIIDDQALFRKSRPEGAPTPEVPAETTSEEPQGFYRSERRKARAYQARGNLVRAAIKLKKAQRISPAKADKPTEAEAHRQLDELIARLQPAAEIENEEVERWGKVLRLLLDKSDQGVWPQEARFLYDLQQACIIAEREVYALSLVSWVTRGQLKLPLTDQRDIRIIKHLRTAERRLPAVRLYQQDREELSTLLKSSTARLEERLRAKLRPALVEAADESGLTPEDVPEQVARDRVVEELLDLVIGRGFLTYSDVRDVISRNQYKLDDLAGPGEFFKGDGVLRFNKALKARSAGSYRSAEVYHRALQKFSSLASGTPWGRFLIMYGLLPLASAFGILAALEHVAHKIEGWTGSAEAKAAAGLDPFSLLSGVNVMAMTAVMFVLIHSPKTRQNFAAVWHGFTHALRAVFFDLPKWFMDLEPVKAVLLHPLYKTVQEYVFRPLRLTALFWVVLWLLDHPWHIQTIPVVSLFFGLVIGLNNRWWRASEEWFNGTLVTGWQILRKDFLQGVLRLIMAAFRRLGEVVEKGLYTVDEALRFRGEESWFTASLKVALLPLWLPVSYLLRLTYDTFIEPRINPIKYFSVVIVADKIALAMYLEIVGTAQKVFLPLGAATAAFLAQVAWWALPAFAGFLVWEFKENWKLYRANRSKTLKPSPVTAHGETLPMLLRPAVHAHTLPELYAKLRQAEREAHTTNDWTTARTHRAALDQIRIHLRHFVERELLSLLRHSTGWGERPIQIGEIETGLYSVSVELRDPDDPRHVVRLLLENDSGWLLASLHEKGWLAGLPLAQRHAFATALIGFYKLSGVDIINEQVETVLSSFRAWSLSTLDVTSAGLKLVPGRRVDAQAVYPLRNKGLIEPKPVLNSPIELPPIPSHRLNFNHVPLTWSQWIDAWKVPPTDSDHQLARLLDLHPLGDLDRPRDLRDSAAYLRTPLLSEDLEPRPGTPADADVEDPEDVEETAG